MSVMASQVTSLTIIYSTVYSATDKENHKSSVSLAFVRGIHRWPVNYPHKGPVTRKTFPFDDVIMQASVLIPGPDCGWHGAHVQWARLCPQLPVRQWHRPRGCRCQELPVSVGYHWHENAGILMKFPSLASPEVVIWQLPVQPWRHFRFNDDCVSQYIIGCWVYDLYIYMYHIFDLGHVCVCVRACVRARMCWRKEIITIRSQYVTVILRYPKARPQDTPRPNGRRMGWRSWVQSLTKVLPLCILCCTYYRVINDRDISIVYRWSGIPGYYSNVLLRWLTTLVVMFSRIDVHGGALLGDNAMSRKLNPDEYSDIRGFDKPVPVRWMAPEYLRGTLPTSESDAVRTFSSDILWYFESIYTCSVHTDC